MDQIAIGKFIAHKRRGLNLTQEQLAASLGISNKSISKWETGKCLPDYATIAPLCRALGITVSELLDGEVNEKENLRVYDSEQILALMKRVQQLESQKNMLMGIALMVMGIALFFLSNLFGGSDVKDFLSGALLGVSIGEMLIGVFVVIKSLLP